MGVEKQLLKAGHGPKPVRGQSVTVHCTGFGKDGDLSKKFWSTKDPGQQPFTFKIGLGSVIKGWDEGVMDMQVGEVARLQIMVMEPVAFQLGVSVQTRSWSLKSKSSTCSNN
ncbi:Peptidyl-prolyl cis-trans isomerase [Musa troglodytarum]|uniref:peptidylprolyl isomerase n=1 Tax=Musa troglodytarum TaxID=320322 RepID=A0A9E7K184_9LILI|nr:Peptidyl-prolyl cis-trans isomerase [Musa troglodytarum]